MSVWLIILWIVAFVAGVLAFLIWISSGGSIGQNRPPSGMPGMPSKTKL